MNDVLNKTCPKCKSASVVRAGVYGTKKDGKRQRFECKDCFSTFY
jgi:transposase-like protein